MKLKELFLFWFGGSFYVTLEVFYRGYSHISMFVLAGVVFSLVGLLNEVFPWEFDLVWQDIIGTGVALIGEYFTGMLVNVKLGLNIWDYSNEFLNLNGQICLKFGLIWIPLILLAIVMDDIIRWRFYGEERPRYYLFGKMIKI